MKKPFAAGGGNWRMNSPIPHRPASAVWTADDRVPKKDPVLETALLTLVGPHTAGDPMTTTKWLNCRLNDWQAHLADQGHPASRPVISRLLKAIPFE